MTVIKTIAIALPLFCSALNLFAQESLVKLSVKREADKSVVFEYEKADPGSFAAILQIKNLENTRGEENSLLKIKGYAGTLTTLKPANSESHISFTTYSCVTIRGKAMDSYQSDIIYLLPYRKGTKVKVSEAGFVNAKYFGTSTPEDWKVYHFITAAEEEITAVRKGLVVDIKDLHASKDTKDIVFTSLTNQLTIEHPDGTIATYKGFKKGSIGLKIGQTVYPGTVLGTNSQTNSNQRYSVSLMVTYLKQQQLEQLKNDYKKPGSVYGYVTPKYYTAEKGAIVLEAKNEYTCEDKPEIIQQELSKKEIKQLGKS